MQPQWLNKLDIGEFEEVDDHRSGKVIYFPLNMRTLAYSKIKIVVQLIGRYGSSHT